MDTDHSEKAVCTGRRSAGIGHPSILHAVFICVYLWLISFVSVAGPLPAADFAAPERLGLWAPVAKCQMPRSIRHALLLERPAAVLAEALPPVGPFALDLGVERLQAAAHGLEPRGL